VFGLHLPVAVPEVPTKVLHPKQTWEDGEAFEAAAAKLAGMFRENFEQFSDRVSDEVKAAGPR